MKAPGASQRCTVKIFFLGFRATSRIGSRAKSSSISVIFRNAIVHISRSSCFLHTRTTSPSNEVSAVCLPHTPRSLESNLFLVMFSILLASCSSGMSALVGSAKTHKRSKAEACRDGSGTHFSTICRDAIRNRVMTSRSSKVRKSTGARLLLWP